MVTDSNVRAALAVVRSLGRGGHAVIVTGQSKRSLCAASRYTAKFVASPPPATRPDEFVAAVLEIIGREGIDVVLPVSELATLLLVEHRARLPTGCILPFASTDSIRRAADKIGLLALAQRLEVSIPGSAELQRSPSSAGDLPRGLQYPVVIKPGRSRTRVADKWIGTKVRYAQDERDLLALLTSLDAANYPLLLQERIEGPGVGYFACYDHGRLVASFAHRRLREKPPSGGVSVLRESIPVNEQALRSGSRLLEALGWHGVAMVEFKQDLRDGSLRLMEINPRFWGSLQLAIDSGVDFPAILADIAAGQRVEPVTVYRSGIRSRWFLGDLDALLSLLFHSRERLKLPRQYPSRLRVIWDFLHFWRKDEFHEVLRWDDLRPGIAEIGQWLRGRRAE